MEMTNLLEVLYVPGRWEDIDPLATTFYVYCGPQDGGVYGHCQSVDLMVWARTVDMELVDTMVRLGLCAMFKLSDTDAPLLEVVYYNHPVEWQNCRIADITVGGTAVIACKPNQDQ